MPGLICTITKTNQHAYQFEKQIEIACNYPSELEAESYFENGFQIAIIKPCWLKNQRCLLVNDDYVFAFYGSIYDTAYTNQLDNNSPQVDALFNSYKKSGVKVLKGLKQRPPLFTLLGKVLVKTLLKSLLKQSLATIYLLL